METRLALALAAARTAVCGWRAEHQSITIDEAHTFNYYVAGPWSNFYARYIPHNHVLYSFAARASVAVFGTSEVALRLPSVIAGFFLVLGTFRVLEMVNSRALRWAALIALSLNPLLLDFTVAARGYGLGLAFLVWAIDASMRGRDRMCGILLGLAVSAQLSMAVPAMALVVSMALISRRFRSAARALGPAAAVAMAICVIPLRHADPHSFSGGAGYATLRESIYSLVLPSTTNREGLFISAHTPGVYSEIAVVLLIAAFIAAETIRDLVRRPDRRILAPVALLISAISLVAARHLAQFAYPGDRTGLFLILLFGLSWAICCDAVKVRWLRGVNLVLAGALTVQFALQFEPRWFSRWKFDMDTRRVALMIQQECAGKPADSVSVSAVWIHRQSLEYYRQVLPIPALRPVAGVAPPSGADPPPMSGYDFYVLNPGVHDPRPDAAHFRVLFSSPDSGIILAVPR